MKSVKYTAGNYQTARVIYINASRLYYFYAGLHSSIQNISHLFNKCCYDFNSNRDYIIPYTKYTWSGVALTLYVWIYKNFYVDISIKVYNAYAWVSVFYEIISSLHVLTITSSLWCGRYRVDCICVCTCYLACVRLVYFLLSFTTTPVS